MSATALPGTSQHASHQTNFAARPVPHPDYARHPAYGGRFHNPSVAKRMKAIAAFAPWFGVVLAKRALMFDRLPTMADYDGPRGGGAGARIALLGRYLPLVARGLAREVSRRVAGWQSPPLQGEAPTVFRSLDTDGIVGVRFTAGERQQLAETVAPYLSELQAKRAAQTRRTFEGNQRWINRREGHGLYAVLDDVLGRHGVIAAASRYLGRPVELKHLTLQINGPDDSFHYKKFEDVGLPDPPTNYMHIDTSEEILKCMIYLNEVTDGNGAFCYVPGSHRVEMSAFEGLVRRTNDRAGLSGYSPEMRELFMALPRPLRYKCTFGADLLTEDPDTRELVAAELRFTSTHGDACVFDNLGIHRGALITEGERRVIIANLA